VEKILRKEKVGKIKERKSKEDKKEKAEKIKERKVEKMEKISLLLFLPFVLSLRFMPNTFTDLSEECSKEGIITVVQNWGGGRNMKSFSTKYG